MYLGSECVNVQANLAKSVCEQGVISLEKNKKPGWYGVMLVFVVCVSGLILAQSNAVAQDLEPRKYVSTPVGQNFARMAAGYLTGEVNLSPGLPFEGAELSVWGASAAYLRTFDIGGNASSFDAYLPYFCADGSALNQRVPVSRNVCGMGDARLRLTYNFVGAPSVSLEEFARREEEVVIGTSLQVQIPTGQYDNTKVLNIGANRWVIRPEIGMSVPLGKWGIGFAAGARFFQDNDDYAGGSTLTQDPLFNLQAHIVYELSARQWLALNGNYFFGGETFRDGKEAQLKQENARLGLTWNVAMNSTNVIQLTASYGVITRVGNDSKNISFAWVHRWE